MHFHQTLIAVIDLLRRLKDAYRFGLLSDFKNFFLKYLFQRDFQNKVKNWSFSSCTVSFTLDFKIQSKNMSKNPKKEPRVPFSGCELLPLIFIDFTNSRKRMHHKLNINNKQCTLQIIRGLVNPVFMYVKQSGK